MFRWGSDFSLSWEFRIHSRVFCLSQKAIEMEDIFDLAIGKSRTMVMLRKRLPYQKDETNFPTMSFYLWWAASDGF